MSLTDWLAIGAAIWLVAFAFFLLVVVGGNWKPTPRPPFRPRVVPDPEPEPEPELPAGARRCDGCGVVTFNDDHVCVEYDDDRPCAKCGAGTVFVFAGAPGTGTARVCRNNHYSDSTIRELEPWECV